MSSSPFLKSLGNLQITIEIHLFGLHALPIVALNYTLPQLSPKDFREPPDSLKLLQHAYWLALLSIRVFSQSDFDRQKVANIAKCIACSFQICDLAYQFLRVTRILQKYER
ncbi:hypothetical protein FGO68_gene7786 [Halteria grandinella]|uniref:Uncharacterized protein n=1 Tax=Halteria grandinella TaxID=5974 RepID=A0A8J8NSS1_HALGN|nr:hypothetical protein FGO68_gene7786 [Halteria grandinella]